MPWFEQYGYDDEDQEYGGIAGEQFQQSVNRLINQGPEMNISGSPGNIAGAHVAAANMQNISQVAANASVQDILNAGNLPRMGQTHSESMSGRGAAYGNTRIDSIGGNNFISHNAVTGDLYTTPRQTEQAVNNARAAIRMTMQDVPQGDTTDMVGTIVARVNKMIGKMYDKAISEAETPVQAATTQAIKNITHKAAQGILQQATGNTINGEFYEAMRGRSPNLSFMSRDNALAYLGQMDIGLQQRVSEYGFSRAMNSSSALYFGGDNGMGVMFGGRGGNTGGGGGYSGRGGGGMNQLPGFAGGLSRAMGGAMYSLYQMGRVSNYTAGGILSAANQYADQMAEGAPLYRQAFGEFTGTGMDASGRMAAMTGAWGQRAYEQFGAASDVGYGLGIGMGGGAGMRMAQTGIMGAAMPMMAQPLLNMAVKGGLMSAGAAGSALTGTAVAGGALIGVGAVNEAANAFFGLQGKPDMQMGLGERLSYIGTQSAYGLSAADLVARSGNSTGARLLRAVPYAKNLTQLMLNGSGYGEEDVISGMGSRWSELYQGRKTAEGWADLNDTVSSVARRTGAKSSDLQGPARNMLQLTGSTDATKYIMNTLAQVNTPVTESMQDVAGMASAMGYLPGDRAGIMALAGQYANTDDRGRAQMAEQAQMYQSIGGMFSSYMGSRSAGASLAREYGLSMNSARVAQSYMSVATDFGQDLNQVVSYEISKAEGPLTTTPITAAEAIAQRAKSRTPYQASIDVGVAKLGMASGMEFGEALGSAERFGIETQGQLNVLGSWGREYEKLFGQASVDQFSALAGQSVGQNQFQSGLIGSVASTMALGGYNAFASLSTAGVSNQYMYNVTSAIGGNIQAASYMHATGQANIPGLAFFDRSGRSVIETSGRAAMSVANAQYNAGNESAARFLGSVPSLFADNQELGNIFMDQGLSGVRDYYSDKMYQNQMAGIGVGYAKIAENERYLFGGDRGGTWNNPAQGSMWQLQDVQRRYQYQSTMAGFASQSRRMAFQHEYAVASEGLQAEQMATTHAFQNWNMGFNRESSLLNRQFTQQNWQYQDQMNSMQFGWSMEDMDEAIRMSSGRSRRQLVTQKERAVLSHNMEGQQQETQRSQQETVWAREDERYKKQEEYTEKLQKLDDDRFELQVNRRETLEVMDKEDFERSKQEYEQMRKLNERMIKAEREHQAAMLNLQRAGLSVQAEAARLQKEQKDDLDGVAELWKDVSGEVENMSKYDIGKYMSLFSDAVRLVGSQDAKNIEAQTELFRKIGDVNTDAADAVRVAVEAYSGTTEPANAVASMLTKLSGVDKTGTFALSSLLRNSANIDDAGVREVTRMMQQANKVNTYRIRTLINFLTQF